MMARVQAFEGSGDETQIDQTPVDLENGPTPEPVFNCWSCKSESSFDSCLENGQVEYCNQGSAGSCMVKVDKYYAPAHGRGFEIVESVSMGCMQPNACSDQKKSMMRDFKTCQPIGPFSRFLDQSHCIQCCLHAGCTSSEGMSFNNGAINVSWSQVENFTRNFWIF